ncbi:DUF4145 domain-containing protein [Variovorax sp. CCNWLW225]|uniref:DUF4145 domain-containing protein n=1 Tax=Variovorax sp. CCNWLW225 TaxID=3127462 RepID=UPI0030787EF5
MKDNLHGTGEHRLYRCAGCGRGGLAFIIYRDGSFPGARHELWEFLQEVGERLRLPADTPAGIAAEFREAEKCQSNCCYRATAGMFRSVLDKTLRANGYKLKPGTNLEQQIDLAGADGVITEPRRRRAHDEVRVLGNDVLHDEWREIPAADGSSTSLCSANPRRLLRRPTVHSNGPPSKGASARRGQAGCEHLSDVSAGDSKSHRKCAGPIPAPGTKKPAHGGLRSVGRDGVTSHVPCSAARLRCRRPASRRCSTAKRCK